MGLLTALIFSFLLIAFFCAVEIAFSKAHKVKIRLWKKSHKLFAHQVENFITDPDRFLVPTLVGTNLASVAFASALTYFLLGFGIDSHTQVVFYESIAIVIFAEVIPKIIARNTADKAVFVLVLPFLIFKYILTPLNLLVGKMSRMIMHLMKIKIDDDDKLLVTKNDIDHIVEHAVKHEAVEEHHADIIKRIMNLSENKIKEIMTHRKSIIGVDISSPLYKLKKLIKLTSLSKIIVYEKDLDDIKGVVFVNDTLKDISTIDEILKPVTFVPESKSILSLFQFIKKDNTSIVITIDEFGGCTGLVTMHDILESIFGRVDDLNDNEITNRGIIYREEQNILIVNGGAGTDDINNMYKNLTGIDRDIVSEEYETINGFIINHLEIIPQQGEEFVINKLKFKIARAKKNIIESIIIKLPKTE